MPWNFATVYPYFDKLFLSTCSITEIYQKCCIFTYYCLPGSTHADQYALFMLSYASPTTWCQPLNSTIAAFELKSLLHLRLRPLCLTNVHIMCFQCLCFQWYEVLERLSVWSEVQMICIWSSWCQCCHIIISCSSEIQNGLSFWCRLTQVVSEKNAVK